MIRVLALIKDKKDIVGFRLYDETSKAFGDYEVEQAINCIRAYGCSNMKLTCLADIDSTECSIDRIPVLDRMLNKTSGGSYFIISKTIGSREILYTVLDIQGKTCEISDMVIINRVKADDLVNAKIVYKGGNKIISAIKGSLKNVSTLEDTNKVETAKQEEAKSAGKSKEKTKKSVERYLELGWQPIYKFADNCIVLAMDYEEDMKLIKPDGIETAKAIKIEWMKHNKVADPTYADMVKYKLREKLDEHELDTLARSVKTERQLKTVLLKYNAFHLDNNKELTFKIMAHGKYIDVWDYYDYKDKKYAVVRKRKNYFGLVDCETLKEIIPCYFENQADPLFANEKGEIELSIPLRDEAFNVWSDLSRQAFSGKSEIKGYFDLNTGKCTNIKAIEITDTDTEEEIEMGYDIENKTYF